MKFGKHLEKVNSRHPEWQGASLSYNTLKRMLKELHLVTMPQNGLPMQRAGITSLTVPPAPNGFGSSLVARYDGFEVTETDFFKSLDKEMEKIEDYTSCTIAELHTVLNSLKAEIQQLSAEDITNRAAEFELKAKKIGDDFLSLEKFVNLNFRGFYKILKKHDKLLPATPCRQFYMARLHQQRWINSDFSSIFVELSSIHSVLRKDTAAQQQVQATQDFVRSTTKYWVRTEDVSRIKHHILQHLPVFQVDQDHLSGDSQLTNSVYLDNSSLELYKGRLDKAPNAIAIRLRWYGTGNATKVFVERKTHQDSWTGEVSVKQRFALHESQVVPFLLGEWKVEDAVAQAKAEGMPTESLKELRKLFTEINQQIDSKQLVPMIRTQYMRTAFQIPFDASVRISLDTNLAMVRENPDSGPTCLAAGRWCRDPKLPLSRSEITRFPHAVLEVKLAVAEGQEPPDWVQEMLASNLVSEVHKFSKFIHGTAVLVPDLVQAVPYWFDDVSIRESILYSTASELHDSKQRRTAEEMLGVLPGLAGTSSSINNINPITGGAPLSNVRVSCESLHGREGDLVICDKHVVDITQNQARTSAGNNSNNNNNDLLHPLLSRELRSDILGGGLARKAAGARGRSKKRGWFAGIWHSMFGPKERLLTRQLPTRIEPKTFFANERTFLSWMHMSVTLGSVSSGLLAFSLDSKGTSTQGMQVIALVLLAVAMMFCVHAAITFYWRASMISRRHPGPYDDRRGPLLLAVIMGLGLWSIFVMSMLRILDPSSYGLPHKHG